MKDEMKDNWFYAISVNDYVDDGDPVEKIIKNGIDVNCTNYAGDSGLMCSIIHQSKRVMKILLNMPNININYKNEKTGESALTCAAKNEFLYQISELLRHRNINVNIQDDQGLTSLMILARSLDRYFWDFKIKLIILFLSHSDINLNIKDNRGYTFLDYIKNNNDFLKDYKLQKRILRHNERNIVLFNKYDIVHPDIKKEHSKIFENDNINYI